jgi:REP element-mobilizing transposase RayT
MPDKFKNRYRIPSSRLSTWDYSSNASYFITICTKNREHYFGNIINAKMHLSPIGEWANDCWVKIPTHFSHFHLDEFVVMPNHVHGIVIIEKPYIDNNSLPNITETGHTIVETGHVETGHALSLRNPEQSESIPKSKHPRFRNQGKNTISAMVGSFKSAVTKYCNENKLKFGWQTRFHDHIIRDAEEFYRIRNYIIDNYRNWKQDKFYSQ